jgi:hypothetical protein
VFDAAFAAGHLCFHVSSSVGCLIAMEAHCCNVVSCTGVCRGGAFQGTRPSADPSDRCTSRHRRPAGPRIPAALGGRAQGVLCLAQAEVDAGRPAAPPQALYLISHDAARRSVFCKGNLCGLCGKVNGYSDAFGAVAPFHVGLAHLVMLLQQSKLGGDEGQAAPCSAFFE